MSILGIDYGQRHIGLALSSEHLIADPFDAISRKNAHNTIASICKEHSVTKIVIGLAQGAIAKEIQQFGEVLQKRNNLDVVYWDETLTTKKAIQALIASGRGQKRRREKEHAASAALILQDYLDEHKN